LAALLASSTVHKVGRQLGADFEKIRRQFNIVCRGSSELSAICKDRQLVQNISTSIPQLAALILRRRLDVGHIPLVPNWSSNEHVEHVKMQIALCAWSILAIYQQAIKYTPTGRKFSSIPSPGTAVSIYPKATSQIAAYGFVCTQPEIPRAMTNKTLVLIDIRQILSPGCLIDNGQGKSFQDMGLTPMTIAVPLYQLRTVSDNTLPFDHPFPVRQDRSENPSIPSFEDDESATIEHEQEERIVVSILESGELTVGPKIIHLGFLLSS
jgi:hypothetical protein